MERVPATAWPCTVNVKLWFVGRHLDCPTKPYGGRLRPLPPRAPFWRQSSSLFLFWVEFQLCLLDQVWGLLGLQWRTELWEGCVLLHLQVHIQAEQKQWRYVSGSAAGTLREPQTQIMWTWFSKKARARWMMDWWCESAARRQRTRL